MSAKHPVICVALMHSRRRREEVTPDTPHGRHFSDGGIVRNFVQGFQRRPVFPLMKAQISIGPELQTKPDQIMKTIPTLLLTAFAFAGITSTALAGPDGDTFALRQSIAKASRVSSPGCSACTAKPTGYVLSHGKGNVVAKR